MTPNRDERVRMERAHVQAWPALHTARIDGWLWRASGGGSQRANSVSTIDFTGTDPQSRGPVNSVFPVTVSMVVSTLLSLSDPTIMPNHGFYRPIHVKAPAGSLVNPRFSAPAVGFPDVCNRIVDVVIAALAPVIPERVIAATSGTTCNTFLGGRHPATGDPYVWYSINSQGGWGGRASANGWHNVCFIEANGWDIPVETIAPGGRL